MTSPPVLRALLALLVLGLSAFYATTQPARLGLDLRGGTSITLETEDSPTTVADAEATDRAVEVLRRRVDALGVSEPTLARSGENRIIVELPGVQDSAAAAEAVGQTAQLTFHPVLGPGDPTQVVGPQPSIEPAPLLTAVPRRRSPRSRRRPRPDGATPAPQPSAAPSQGRAAPSLPGRRPRAPRRPPPRAARAAPAPAPLPTPSAGASAAPEVGEDAEFDPSAEQTVVDDSGQPVRLGPASLTGEDVEDAAATVDTQTGTTRSSTSTSRARAAASGSSSPAPPPAPSRATRRAASRSCSTARSSARRR
jgi:SecD/SecF fusion protein